MFCTHIVHSIAWRHSILYISLLGGTKPWCAPLCISYFRTGARIFPMLTTHTRCCHTMPDYNWSILSTPAMVNSSNTCTVQCNVMVISKISLLLLIDDYTWGDNEQWTSRDASCHRRVVLLSQNHVQISLTIVQTLRQHHWSISESAALKATLKCTCFTEYLFYFSLIFGSL